MKSKPKVLTAKTLKEVLWDTLQGLRENKIEVEEAVATSSLAKAIVSVAHIQLKVAVSTGRAVPQEVIKFTES